MILAAGLFIKRVTDTTRVSALDEGGNAGEGHEPPPPLPPGVLVYRVFGALLFGAADKLDSVLRRSGDDTRVVVLHLASVNALDATALNALETLQAKLSHHGRHLVLSGPHTQPYALLERSGFLERLGPDNVAADLPSAVERARELAARPRAHGPA
jgi:SulP family sulfate permease